MFGKLLSRIRGWPFDGRQRRMLQVRPALSKEQFVVLFSSRGVSVEIAAEVWDRVSAWCVEGFTPSPEDDLGWLYGLAEEELELDIILELLERFDCYIPSYEEMVSERQATRTVGDVVTFIDAMYRRKHHEPGA